MPIGGFVVVCEHHGGVAKEVSPEVALCAGGSVGPWPEHILQGQFCPTGLCEITLIFTGDQDAAYDSALGSLTPKYGPPFESENGANLRCPSYLLNPDARALWVWRDPATQQTLGSATLVRACPDRDPAKRRTSLFYRNDAGQRWREEEAQQASESY
jgi:hypothetical protein